MAVGIDAAGTKHLLALAEGDTENATVVKDLLVGSSTYPVGYQVICLQMQPYGASPVVPIDGRATLPVRHRSLDPQAPVEFVHHSGCPCGGR